MKKILFFSLFSFVFSYVFAAGSGEGQMTFGVTIERFDDVFMQRVLDAVEDEASKADIKVVSADAKNDPVEQLKIVDNFITSGVDAMIVHLVNQDVANTITKKALDAGIPLVYMNRRPNDSGLPAGKMVAAVASPEEKAGEGQAKFVAEALGGKGNVAILLGSLGSGPQIGRTKGAKDYFANNTNIKVVKEQTANFIRPEALNVVENWLASSGDDFIDAIVANNDEMAIGAAKALSEKGLGDVIVVGVDASPDGIVALEAGDLDMTMYQNGDAQGRGSVQVALKMIQGEAFEQDIKIPFEPVTKENISDYK